MRRASVPALALLALATACSDMSNPVPTDLYTGPSAAVAAGAQERYIVVFDPGTADAPGLARALVAQHGGLLSHTYEHALKGFAATLPVGAAAALRAHPSVTLVEEDQIAYAVAQTVPTGVRRIFADDNPNLDIDGSDDARVDADIAIIDTGIDLDHADLNVVASTNCAGGGPFTQSCGSGGNDDNGHGTHVAGTTAALDNGIGVVGVAPGARLWAVKVLRSDGSGYISWIVAGIDYVTANADQIEVANMSLGCECSSSALDQAITNSVAAGVVYAVAAGNSDANASTFSPANHPDVVTVSALADFDGEPGGLGLPTCRNDQDDTLADFSNWGSTVEIAAPGVCILSTWNDGGTAVISGTSMAAPHVTGAVALYLHAKIPSEDVAFFCVAINIQRGAGGNLAEVLDRLGDVIRKRYELLSHARVLSAQQRYAALFVGFSPVIFCVLFYFLQPGYFDPLIGSPSAPLLVGAGLVMEIIGFAVIWRMARIKV